jgi:hypothetical protein
VEIAGWDSASADRTRDILASMSKLLVDFHCELTWDFHREVTRVDMVPRGAGMGQVVAFSFRDLGAAALALNRKLSLPVSRMWQWCVSRSSSAVVILASPNTSAHSLKLRLVVMTTLVRS